jgi:4-amino-4-deoxy-L-arabinose transferase-like glycosyltransferase
MPNSNKNSWALDLFFITTLISLFFAMFMGSHHLLVPDEGRYVEVAREMVASGNYVTPFLNGIVFLDKPILFYWLQCLAIKIFGLKEWSVRLWPAIIGVFGCVASYVAGRKLFNRRTGIFAAFILATSPLYYILSHYANMDLEVAVFITATLYAFLIAVKLEDSYRRSIVLWIAYTFAALAFLTKGMIGIVFPAMIIGGWIIIFNDWRLLKRIHLLSGLGILVLIVTPWCILEQRANPEFFHYFFVTQHFSRFLTSNFNNPHATWFYLPVVLIGLIPWAFFLVQAFWQKIQLIFENCREHKIEVFLLLWVLLIFMFFSIPRSKLIGYIAPIIPPLVLIISSYIDSALSSMKMTGLKIGVFLWMIFVCSIIVALYCLPYLSISFDFHRIVIERFLTIILLIGGLALVCLFWYRNFQFWLQKWSMIVATLTVTSALLLTISYVAIADLGLKSAKPLAMKINELQKPDDVVVAFYDYYYDLSVYIQKPLFMVEQWDNFKHRDDDDWRSMFVTFSSFEGSQKQWLIDEQQLQKIWHSKKVFIIANRRFIPALTILLNGNIRFLGIYQKNILISN